jgi:putative endonuclease
MLSAAKHPVETPMPSGSRTFYVYILASITHRLYIGFTNYLERRMYEHKHKLVPGFTADYNVNKLVYWEECNDPRDGIAREKQLKGWLRKKKIALIESANPKWKDLAADWFDASDEKSPERDD